LFQQFLLKISVIASVQPQGNPSLLLFHLALKDGSSEVHPSASLKVGPSHGQGSPSPAQRELLRQLWCIFAFAYPPTSQAGGMRLGRSCLLLETSGFALKCRTETIFKTLADPPHPFCSTGGQYYLPRNIFNKKTQKNHKAFGTSRTTYRFLQSRVGFLRVIHLQVIDSGVL